jgi:hypothetical protein
VTASVAPITRAPRPSSLADVLEVILDKGIVIDAYIRVSLVGIEILTIDARIVIASVDTYLRFAEAVNRLDLNPRDQVTGLPGMIHGMTEGGAKSKAKGALSGVKEKASELVDQVRGGGEDDSDDDERQLEDGRSEERERRAPAGRRPPEVRSRKD